MTKVLAVDLGGTNMRAALYTGDLSTLTMLGQGAAPTDLATFTGRLAALRAEAGDIEAVGFAVPGLVQGTTCRWIPNLPYLDGLDMRALLPGLSVGVGNDAQIALLAEAGAGAAKGMSHAILLAIGTGIGSAVLANGNIVAGSHGGACSFGWACADMNDPGEDRSGWLERVASGRALDLLAQGLSMASGADLIAAARAGDRAARTALERPARQLGIALAGAVALLDPEAILISGGISDALDVLGPSILGAMRRQLPAHLKGIEIRPGAFGARAGVVGAALAGAAGAEWRRTR
jgi:predicted NBD/HSP70 family sugar kinase